MTERFLPGVPRIQIEAMFNAAPGNEITTGKFDSPESSAALVANTFGFFLNRPEDLPPLLGCEFLKWPADSLTLERTVRLPWRGGRHPVLDVLITTRDALIGIESKRFEPFRSKKTSSMSNSYWRPVWDDRMKGYEIIRNKIREHGDPYSHLDAAQLFKHAFSLRTQVDRRPEHKGLTPALFYLYAEPQTWPNNGREITKEERDKHRKEVEEFAEVVRDDEVLFVHRSYRNLLWGWRNDPNYPSDIQAHAKAIIQRFAP